MDIFSPLSSTEWAGLLNLFESLLLLFGILLAIGIWGEYKAHSPGRWGRFERQFITLVLIGVWGEILADGGIFLASKKLQVLSDLEVARLKIKTSEAELARAEIMRQISWRTLSDKQRLALGTHIGRELLKTKLYISSIAGDSEGGSYANELFIALGKGGWKLPEKGPGAILKTGELPEGLWIPVPTRTSDAAVTFRAILEGAGLHSNATVDESVKDPGRLDLVVGVKPHPLGDDRARAK